GGSTWNRDKMLEKGITNVDYLIQGIDPELFYPGDVQKNNDLFVIFSGGKFELRKGQDLVLKAVQILQQKFPNVILINSWYNLWPETMDTMAVSRHIKYERKGENWQQFMVNLLSANKIDGNRVFTLPLTPNEKMREVYLKSDIGLFPNRCEGGTNLVLMEFMACGKPVIASFNSGHKDVLTEQNSLPLKHMNAFKLNDNNGSLIADWNEPDLDEIVSKLEFAYYNRDRIKEIGRTAGENMKSFTWSHTADNLVKILR
ncbi:MAG: glycosyltransferase family 4 protein, partial [Bacteroidota bacterium]|nr:glycosyltransferase family 4 protein [Bacteroidota bacterium]